MAATSRQLVVNWCVVLMVFAVVTTTVGFAVGAGVGTTDASSIEPSAVSIQEHVVGGGSSTSVLLLTLFSAILSFAREIEGTAEYMSLFTRTHCPECSE